MKKYLIHPLSLLLLAAALLTACKSENKPAKTGSSEEVAATAEETEFSDADYSSNFVGSFKMNITSYKKGVADTKTLPSTTVYSNGTLTAMNMQLGETGKETRMIMDYNAKTVITLMDNDGKKVAMKMKIPDLEGKTTTEAADVKITETSETKTISGYKCRKYIIESPDMNIECWATKQIKGNMHNLFKGQKDKNMDWQSKMGSMKGFPIEMKNQMKDSEDYMVIRLSDITTSVDPAIFSTEGYDVKDMSDMSKMMEEAAKKYAK